jgi:hypothetical protein
MNQKAIILCICISILTLSGCNLQNAKIQDISKIKNPQSSLEFESGILYIENESIKNKLGEYIGEKQYFANFDPKTKEKQVSGILSQKVKNPKLVKIKGEDRILVLSDKGNSLATDLGYYSLPNLEYTELKLVNPESSWQTGVIDYIVDGKIVYYLKGCTGLSCKLGRFNLSTNTNKILAKEIKLDHLSLSENISENRELYLIESNGHAGSSYINLYTFSLKDFSLKLLKNETKLYFCEKSFISNKDKEWIKEEFGFTGEECTEEQLEQNNRFDRLENTYMQNDKKKCSKYKIEYSSDEKVHLLFLEEKKIKLSDSIKLIGCR